MNFLGWRAHTLHRIIFIATCVCLMIASPYIENLPFEIQVLMLGLFVLVLGMPHGALDPLLAQMFGADLTNGLRHIGFYLAYLAVAGLALAFWFFFPVYALLAFLGISIIHFAGDWEDDIPKWLQLFAGTALITHPAFFFPDQVEQVFSFLVFGEDIGWLVDFLRFIEIPVCVILYSGIVIRYFFDPAHGAVFTEVVLLHFLAALFAPLVYFILYFCGLHSIRHYIETVGELKAAGFSTAKIKSTVELVTVVTAVLIGLSFFFIGDVSIETSVIRAIFISLFALTVPHMFLLGWIKLAYYRYN